MGQKHSRAFYHQHEKTAVTDKQKALLSIYYNQQKGLFFCYQSIFLSMNGTIQGEMIKKVVRPAITQVCSCRRKTYVAQKKTRKGETPQKNRMADSCLHTLSLGVEYHKAKTPRIVKEKTLEKNIVNIVVRLRFDIFCLTYFPVAKDFYAKINEFFILKAFQIRNITGSVIYMDRLI